MKLTEPQERVLVYLHRCEHSTRNIMRGIWGREPTISLRALERQGLVMSEMSRSPMSTNVRWTITEKGHEIAASL